MHVVVCVKQVPRTHDVSIDPETNTLERTGVESVVNPLDRHAVQAAVNLVDEVGGKVTALSMGPPQAEAAVREAMALGCSRGILLSDRAFAGADTWATSYTLAAAVRRLGDVGAVLCGKQATDGDTGQVGPELAAHLGWQQAAYVRGITDTSDGVLTVRCQADGAVEIWRVRLPAVLTVLKDLVEPGLPSLVDRMRARRADVEVWTADDLDAEPTSLGLDGSPTRVQRVYSPPRGGEGKTWTGPPDETVPKLVDALDDEGLI